MANLKSQDALGASLFLSAGNEYGISIGPAIHYRRWLGPESSFEVALGAPVLSTSQYLEKASLFGLVKWSPTNWVAVAARPELVQQDSYQLVAGPCVNDDPCSYSKTTRTVPRLALGLEFSRVPGLALTGAAWAALVGLILTSLVGNHGD